MGTLVRKEYHSRPLGRRTITKPKNECSKLASLATNPNSNPNSNLASLGHNIEERMLLTLLRSGITSRSECSKLASLAITSMRKKKIRKKFSEKFSKSTNSQLLTPPGGAPNCRRPPTYGTSGILRTFPNRIRHKKGGVHFRGA